MKTPKITTILTYGFVGLAGAFNGYSWRKMYQTLDKMDKFEKRGKNVILS